VSVTVLNPEGLPKPVTYRQVALATGSRTVFVAGQVARNAEGELVGRGDLAAQVEQALLNVATALEAVGGTFDHVAKLTAYVVHLREADLASIGDGVARASRRLDHDLARPVTMVGVEALFHEDLLVEIDAVALLD
jgi:enamine deaminase RidA (YjgF/YER057c/UK114 family)